ncbi:MAG: hypothetical protein ACTHZI_12490 [Luteimonas sp.]
MSATFLHNTARLYGVVFIGLALTACGSGEPDAGSPPPSTPASSAVADDPRPVGPRLPAAPSPAFPPGMSPQLEGVPRWNPLSTSDADATPGQVWGEIIGKNVGAAQSCGIDESRIAGYLEGLKWQIRMVNGEASSADSDYQLAYEHARESAAAQERDEHACVEILAAIEG